MSLAAVLFDLDGTLVDSNGAHVEAWCAAMEQRGFRVAADRIAVEIGKGGDQLVRDVLGDAAERAHGDALRAAHGQAFLRIAAGRRLPAAPRAVELLEALRARGLALALATSSQTAHIEAMERSSGVPWRSLFDVVTGADDAATAKPAPDIVEIAVERLGCSPAECAMVGDSPWDAKAAVGAGVVLVGLTFGGNDAAALTRSGARVVYADTAELLARSDDAWSRVSPGSARLDRAALERLMGAALDAAEEGMRAGEVPIGAALARGDGEIVATGSNRYVATGDRAQHAEMAVLHAAGSALPPSTRDAILVSTLEPCVMCLGAAMETAIDVVIYGLRAPADSGTRRVTPPESVENQMPRIVGGIRAAEARALFDRWFERPDRCPEQEPYARQLLAAT